MFFYDEAIVNGLHDSSFSIEVHFRRVSSRSARVSFCVLGPKLTWRVFVRASLRNSDSLVSGEGQFLTTFVTDVPSQSFLGFIFSSPTMTSS